MHGVMDPAKYRKIRDEFGDTVAALGVEIPNMVVLTADLIYPMRTERFAQLCPRCFFDVGVAEQNLVGIAAGLATCGKIPLVAMPTSSACGRGSRFAATSFTRT